MNRAAEDQEIATTPNLGSGWLSGSHLSLDAVGTPTAMAVPVSHPATDQEPTASVLRQAVLVPLIGQIVAGRLTLVDQTFEDFFVLPKQLVGEGALFLLHVRGDSMINAAIADGDLVVIREQPAAENGEIVAAIFDEDEEATIKTYKKSGDNIWLMPENPDYQPILGEKARILGKVVAVIRRL